MDLKNIRLHLLFLNFALFLKTIINFEKDKQ